MFASSSLPEHLARGVVGFGALVAAVILARTPGAGPAAGSAALALLALLILRGCPVCWTVGMVETVIKARRGGGDSS